jgi:DNA-binding NarL/FixJ family response regulator
VVVADENASVRARIRNALDEAPDLRFVASARDAAEACHVTMELNPDVLVLGESLLVAEGRQLFERLRSDRPAVRIVIYADDAVACAEGTRLGAAACVSKNESMQRLVAAIGVVTNIQADTPGPRDADR